MFEASFVLGEDGAALRVHRYGSGPLVVLVHGSCVDSEFFDPLARELSRRFTVVSYDRRGYGESAEGGEGAGAIQIQARDLAAVIENAGGSDANPCCVMACSAGGLVSLELATQRPRLLRTLLLHEPAVVDSLPERHEARAATSRALDLAREGLARAALYEALSGESLDEPRALSLSARELAFFDRNALRFMLHEAPGMWGYVPDYRALRALSVVVATGEGSAGTYHMLGDPELSRRIGARHLWAPGKHNGARDLPYEFACLAAGVFSLS